MSEEIQQEPRYQETYEDKLKAIQSKWVDKVKSLNEKMKSLATLESLLNEIYSERQNACDYYFSLLGILSKLSRKYKVEYASKYTYYKTQSQIRFSSDSSINTQIEADLEEIKSQISLVDNHAKYMQETIKTIDNLIYGVNNKIRVYELINGVKH